MTLKTCTQNLKLNHDFEYKGVVFAFYAHLFRKKALNIFLFLSGL
jgi:hypothetical protein